MVGKRCVDFKLHQNGTPDGELSTAPIRTVKRETPFPLVLLGGCEQRMHINFNELTRCYAEVLPASFVLA